jgi:hypothetical protein
MPTIHFCNGYSPNMSIREQPSSPDQRVVREHRHNVHGIDIFTIHFEGFRHTLFNDKDSMTQICQD